jgi:hypothetical protein
MNWELLIVAICGVFGFFTSIDLFVYIIRKAPVSRVFGKFWKDIGLICTIVVVYYILNGYHLF